MPDRTRILHASSVAVAGRGCLITGASGSGKSSLALSMIAFGAILVADDRVLINRAGDRVTASAPDTIRGLIEARGVGILTCDAADPVTVAMVVDMNETETERLPVARTIELLGHSVTLLRRVDGPHFAPALMQYLRSGRYGP
ncbi:HPr kinase/phosphorylase [Microbulbifer sp. S227A]|uniref:HPr kinase/phosphorylase n=1 Tax=Microbulbifer sp. S227A TaxID=3415131 RepID=UPI003C7E239C